MRTDSLDKEGVPVPGFERKLAHQLLGRDDPLGKRVVYALLGRARRKAELVTLLEGKSANNFTDILRLLEDANVVVPTVDAGTRPPAISYRLTTLGLLVIDWMRRYEFIDEMTALDRDPAIAAPS